MNAIFCEKGKEEMSCELSATRIAQVKRASAYQYAIFDRLNSYLSFATVFPLSTGPSKYPYFVLSFFKFKSAFFLTN